MAAAGSRLNNEKRIIEIAQEIIAELPLKKESFSHGVYIRNFKDQVTVSLDLSGLPLYKRATDKKVGEAPFRETWAHFMLRRMITDLPVGARSQIRWLDPFAGSGTFLLELRGFTTPNFQRRFAFQDLKQAPKLFRSGTFQLNYKLPEEIPWAALQGIDLDARMVQIAEHNLKASLGTQPVKFWTGDAFAGPPQQDLFVVANPPWGGRLPQTASLTVIASALLKAWRPRKLALVWPRQSAKPADIPKDYRLQEKISLNLGGQEVDIWIWQGLL